MIVSSFLYCLLVILIFGFIAFLSFYGARKIKKKNKIIYYLLNTLGSCVIIFLWLIGYLVLDDRFDSEIAPTLYIINPDGSQTKRKIIGSIYHDCDIQFKKSGSYYVENHTPDTIIAYYVFYHFKGESSSTHDAPKIIATIPPEQIEPIDGIPYGLVKEIPMSRNFLVSKIPSYPGRGREAIYLLKK